jgi:hypothetical protein
VNLVLQVPEVLAALFKCMNCNVLFDSPFPRFT